MSERESRFFDLYARGEVQAEDIADFVEAWHTGPEDGTSLSDFLGLTEEEYSLWMRDARTLPRILAARQAATLQRAG